VYQCKNARRLKSCENCEWVRRKRSWTQVLFEMRVAEMDESTGGTEEWADMIEFGIHSVAEGEGGGGTSQYGGRRKMRKEGGQKRKKR
jgi:hypothetical protein